MRLITDDQFLDYRDYLLSELQSHTSRSTQARLDALDAAPDVPEAVSEVTVEDAWKEVAVFKTSKPSDLFIAGWNQAKKYFHPVEVLNVVHDG